MESAVTTYPVRCGESVTDDFQRPEFSFESLCFCLSDFFRSRRYSFEMMSTASESGATPPHVPASAGMGDAALLRAWAVAGSDAAFRQLTDKYINLVFSIALRGVAGGRELAEEVTQNVFALLARKAGSLKADPSISGWLYQTAVLEARSAARRELKRLDKMKQLSEAEPTPTNDHTDPWAEALPLLDGAMDALSHAERELLLLRFYEGRGLRDIAAELGRTEAAVQRQAHRALEKLRHLLGRRGGALPAAIMASGLSAQLAQSAPAGLATTVAQAAPIAAQTISVTTALSNTLLTMSHAKSITIAAALVLAAIPAAYQWRERQRLASHVRDLEWQTAGLGQPGSPDLKKSEARTSATTPPLAVIPQPENGSHKLTARGLLAKFESLRVSSAGQLNALLQSLTDLPLADKAAVLLELRNLESTAKFPVMNALLAKLTEQDPEFAAAFLLKNNFPPHLISKVGSVWGAKNPEAALAWLDQQIAAGTFAADPTLAGGIESSLRAGIIGGLASKDWPRAAKMAHSLPAEAQGYTVYPMVNGIFASKGKPEDFLRFAEPLAPPAAAKAMKAYAGQLRANRTPQVAERLLADPSINPNLRNGLVLGLLDAQGSEEWKTNLPRLLELSDDAHRADNVKTWFQWWSVQYGDAAGAFIRTMSADAPERDFALAGHAVQMARNNSGPAARDLAEQIGNSDLRSATLGEISKETSTNGPLKPPAPSETSTFTPVR